MRGEAARAGLASSRKPAVSRAANLKPCPFGIIDFTLGGEYRHSSQVVSRCLGNRSKVVGKFATYLRYKLLNEQVINDFIYFSVIQLFLESRRNMLA